MKRLITKNGKTTIVDTVMTEISVNSMPNEEELEIPLKTHIDMPRISPIIEAGTFEPVKVERPHKAELKLITKDELYTEVQKHFAKGEKNLPTELFAVMITPKIKRSENLEGHIKWDMAHGHIRKLMVKLKADKKLRWEKKGLHFVCNPPIIRTPKVE